MIRTSFGMKPIRITTKQSRLYKVQSNSRTEFRKQWFAYIDYCYGEER